MEPEFGPHGYPTKATLERIRTWPQGTWTELMEYVAAAWKWGLFKRQPKDYVPVSHLDGDAGDGRWWAGATGGWSGNEDLVAALQDNTLFWSTCARAWMAGGWWEFHVPPGA